eukprot:1160076-Pelagomonas_calceolata.AAC.3
MLDLPEKIAREQHDAKEAEVTRASLQELRGLVEKMVVLETEQIKPLTQSESACPPRGSGRADAPGDAPGGDEGRRFQAAGGGLPLTVLYLSLSRKALIVTTTHQHVPYHGGVDFTRYQWLWSREAPDVPRKNFVIYGPGVPPTVNMCHLRPLAYHIPISVVV